MEYLPLIAFAAIIVLFITYAGRQRRKQQAVQRAMSDQIGVGTEVMTTSGLYGTVVARHADETVTLSIAPGVEVKWELAALRDVATLPRQFQGRPVVDDAEANDGTTVQLDKGDSDNRGGAR